MSIYSVVERSLVVLMGLLLVLIAPLWVSALWLFAGVIVMRNFYEAIVLIMVAEYVFRGDYSSIIPWVFVFLIVMFEFYKDRSLMISTSNI